MNLPEEGVSVDDRLDLVRVAVAVDAIVVWRRDERVEQLVLERIVTADGAGQQARVEESWTSTHGSVRSTIDRIHALRPVVTDLLLGRPVHAPADMSRLENTELVRLEALIKEPGRREERLVECHGVIRAAGGQPELLYAEVVSTPGSIEAQQAEAVFAEAVSALPMDAAGPEGDPAAGSADGQDADSSLGGSGFSMTLHRELVEVVSSAQCQAEQLRQWDRLPPLRLIGEPTRVGWGTGEEVAWTHWEHSPEGSSTAEPDLRLEPGDHFVITLIDVDGAVVGNDSLQINVFEFEVNATLDLAPILRQRDVRDALSAYAVDPADPEKRQGAIESLRSSPTGRQIDWGQAWERSHAIHRQSDGSIGWLGGTVVLSGCRGVQIGNHVKQHNTFTHVVSPRVSGQLFVTNPEVVESIVDFACRTDGPSNRLLQERLADAVCASARGALERTPGSGQHSTANLTLKHEQAQIIGSANEQRDSYDVTASIKKLAALAHEKQRLSLETEAARKVEAARLRRTEEVSAARLRPEAEHEVGRRLRDRVEIGGIEPPAMRSPEVHRMRM